MAIFWFLRWRRPPSWIIEVSNFNSPNDQEGWTASSSQISSKSLESRPRYGDFSIFQDGAFVRGESVEISPRIFGIRKLESLGYRTVKKIGENCKQLSRVHQRYSQTDRRQTTDGRAMAYSERERKFTSAKNAAATGYDKNSSVDEIAKSTFYDDMARTYFKILKREPTSFNH